MRQLSLELTDSGNNILPYKEKKDNDRNSSTILVRREILGFFPRNHPLLGNFLHAPILSSAESKYVGSGIKSAKDELSDRLYRSNPYIGYFRRGTSLRQLQKRASAPASPQQIPLLSTSPSPDIDPRIIDRRKRSDESLKANGRPRGRSLTKEEKRMNFDVKMQKRALSANSRKQLTVMAIAISPSNSEGRRRSINTNTANHSMKRYFSEGSTNNIITAQLFSSSNQTDKTSQNKWYIKRGPSIASYYDINFQEPIGYGSYSSVYPCIFKTTGQEFAVKSVRKKMLFSDEEKLMLTREMEIQRTLIYPNVIRLFDTFEDEEFVHLVLEKATHATLDNYLVMRGATFGIGEIEAAYIIRQILLGVEYIHASGVLHADIKPQNILLVQTRNVEHLEEIKLPASLLRIGTRTNADFPPLCCLSFKLCDFGFSRRVPDVKFFKYTGSVHKVPYTNMIGTPGYTAPCILKGESYGQPADVYSAGAILFELITGMRPTLDREGKEVRFPVSLFSGKGTSVINLIRRMLTIDTSKRITAKDALKHQWFVECGLA